MTTREKRGTFSREEDREVITKFGLVPTDRLARQMGRQVAAVGKRAVILFRGKPVKGRWAKHETTRLKELFGVATPEQIAVILRRTPVDVKAASGRLRSRAKTHEPLSGVELADFKLMYGTRTDDDLTAIFGRTPELIAASAEVLCLSKDKAFIRRSGGGTKMPRWDPASVEALKIAYPTVSNHELAQQLGRSIKSVVSKAHALRLKKDHERLRQMGRDNVAKRYEK